MSGEWYVRRHFRNGNTSGGVVCGFSDTPQKFLKESFPHIKVVKAWDNLVLCVDPMTAELLIYTRKGGS